MFNKVILVGNLTRDPEVRSVGSNTVTAFGMACNRKFKTQSGEQRDEAMFIDCEAWGVTGENVAKFLARGSKALVEGRLKFDEWEDRETGAKRSKHRVVAEFVRFLDAPGEGGERPGPRDVPVAGGPTKPAIDHDDIPFD